MLIEHIKKWNYFNKNIIKILFVMYYQYGVVIVYHIVKVIFILIRYEWNSWCIILYLYVKLFRKCIIK